MAIDSAPCLQSATSGPSVSAEKRTLRWCSERRFASTISYRSWRASSGIVGLAATVPGAV